MPQAPRRPDDDPVVLTDPLAVRALAHPARLTVIDALYAGEVLTATECARRAGISPSAMSYHLRALERFGIVRRAEQSGDARQRPWRSAGSALQISMRRAQGKAGAAAATEVLLETTMAEDRRRLVAAAGGADDGEWRAATFYDRSLLLLDPDEARGLHAQVEELVAPYRADSRGRAAGAEPVVFAVTMVREAAPQ